MERSDRTEAKKTMFLDIYDDGRIRLDVQAGCGPRMLGLLAKLSRLLPRHVSELDASAPAAQEMPDAVEHYGTVDDLPAAQATPEPVALGPLAKRNIYDAIRAAYDLGYNDARNARTVPGDSAPGYDGRSVEEDHGSALFNLLTKRLKPATPEPVGEVVAWLYAEDGETKFGHPRGYRPDDARPLVFGDTRPAPGVPPTKDQIRDVFIGNGFTIKEGQTDLKPYVYAAADALLKLVSPALGVPEGWTDADADAARLAMELECLLLDTKDTAAVSRWWTSANEALDLHRARLAAAQPKGADK